MNAGFVGCFKRPWGSNLVGPMGEGAVKSNI